MVPLSCHATRPMSCCLATLIMPDYCHSTLPMSSCQAPIMLLGHCHATLPMSCHLAPALVLFYSHIFSAGPVDMLLCRVFSKCLRSTNNNHEDVRERLSDDHQLGSWWLECYLICLLYYMVIIIAMVALPLQFHTAPHHQCGVLVHCMQSS